MCISPAWLAKITSAVGISLCFSASIFATWNNNSYTQYPSGTYGVTAPQPGANIYYAQDSQGSQGNGILYYDPNPPTFAGSAQTIAASANKSVTVNFSDALSGIASASVTVFDPDNVSIGTFGGGANLTFTGNFSKAGKYKLNWSATDNATNSASGVVNDFFTVVAAAPAFTPGASTITTSSGTTRIADGENSHTVTLTLKDQYGNPIVPVAGLVNVTIKFKFENTNPLDQIAGTGDALRLSGDCNLTGADTGSMKIIECTATTSATGVYNLNLYSYSPTSNAYAPIAADNFKISLTGIDYTITGPGNSNGTKTENKPFAFVPTVSGAFDALNYDTNYTVDADSEPKQVALNAIKRFQFKLTNNSSGEAASAIQVGAAGSAGSGVTWKNPKLETGSSLTALSNSFSAGGWNASPIVELSSGANQTLRLQAVPELTLGSALPNEVASTLSTRLRYEVGGRTTAHKTEGLAPKIYGPKIQITGATRSADTAMNVGDLSSNEVKTAIQRNVFAFTNDAGNSSRACGTGSNISSGSWETLPCTFRQGTLLYFDGTDVNIENDLTVSGKKTLLVKDGNLNIKGDIATAAGGSLGIIVLGGNVKIDPAVTNVSAFLYAEGAVVSIGSAGSHLETTGVCENNSAGFCDRAYELRNQLLWKGIVISQNTIGGSDKNPLACPSGMATCNDRGNARILDFNYLRTFHKIGTSTWSGAKAAGITSDAAFVMQFSDISLATPPLFEGAASSGSSEAGN